MFSFTKNSVNNQTSDETLLITTYELGKVIECHHYSKRYGSDSQTLVRKGYLDHGKTEMSDLISMIRMYCEQQNWDYEELVKLGQKRYIERMRDLIKHGIKSELKEEFKNG